MLKPNDSIVIEKTDGYSIFGFFKKQDDENILIEGNTGENMGKEIIVPKRNVSQIVVIKRRSDGITDQDREDW